MDRPERSVRQLVGRFESARFVEGKRAEVRALFHPITGPGYEWVTSLVESAIESGGGLIGISIDGCGETDGTQEIGGQTYDMIREVTHLGSADIVTQAGAGGGFVRKLQESVRALEQEVRQLRQAPAPKKRKKGKASARERELQEKLDYERERRQSAEKTLGRSGKRAKAQNMIRETGVTLGPAERDDWTKEIAAAKRSDMAATLARKVQTHREIEQELREAPGFDRVEGAGPRPPSGPPSDSHGGGNLLERVLGHDSAAAFEDLLSATRNGHGAWR